MRNKRLTRKEKVALSGGEQLIELESEEDVPKYKQIPAEDVGITDKKIAKKVLIFSQEDAMNDDFIPPKSLFFVDSFGNYVYIATNKRDTAQEICDTISGKKDKFKIKKVIKAITR